MSKIMVGDVLDYIGNTSPEERNKVVSEFLRDMNTLAQSAINIFEKNKLALALYDIGFEFRVVDYSDNIEIIGIKHGFPTNGIPLSKFLLGMIKGESDGMEQSGTSQNESQTE
jgi:hypothetical protein